MASLEYRLKSIQEIIGYSDSLKRSIIHERKDTSANTVIESSQRATTYRFMKGFTPTNGHFHARFVIKHSRDRTT